MTKAFGNIKAGEHKNESKAHRPLIRKKFQHLFHEPSICTISNQFCAVLCKVSNVFV